MRLCRTPGRDAWNPGGMTPMHPSMDGRDGGNTFPTYGTPAYTPAYTPQDTPTPAAGTPGTANLTVGALLLGFCKPL